MGLKRPDYRRNLDIVLKRLTEINNVPYKLPCLSFLSDFLISFSSINFI